MPERLPLTLRSYRRLAAAATPLTSILLAKRLKRGKEDPRRRSVRLRRTALFRGVGASLRSRSYRTPSPPGAGRDIEGRSGTPKGDEGA